MSKHSFERVAHRGAPRERLENTLEGFLLALERGADAIELDVHASGDGDVVVHHDDAARGRRISGATWRDLSAIDLGGATMPRLAEVLDAVGDAATVYIELKGFHIEKAVLAVAAKHGHKYAVHSFDHDAIERLARFAPEVPRGVLLDRGTPNPVDAMRAVVTRLRPRDVWPHWSLVDSAFSQTARELNVRVIPWTVNSVETATTLSELGVAGICTDDVRILANL